jgi:hypothetical protein
MLKRSSQSFSTEAAIAAASFFDGFSVENVADRPGALRRRVDLRRVNVSFFQRIVLYMYVGRPVLRNFHAEKHAKNTLYVCMYVCMATAFLSTRGSRNNPNQCD